MRWWSIDTGFPKDGDASPCVARQYSGTLGKTGNCQIGVSVHLAGEHASCAADWRLFCPQSWDDAALEDPVQAARAASRRARAGIPDDVRHTEKWRLALEMLDEMTGPGGWGGPGPGRCRGGAPARSWLLMPDTATTPRSAWSWGNGAGGTWSRSGAPPARIQAMPGQ